jgi:hypothetical protein
MAAEGLESLESFLADFWPASLQRLKQAVEATMPAEAITASVHVEAQPKRVFAYFTEPEAIVRWVGDYALVPRDTVSSVFEYTILSAACHISAKSRMKGGWSARLMVSQASITSYSRRP